MVYLDEGNNISLHGQGLKQTGILALAKKIVPYRITIRYSCRTEPPKMPRL